MTTSAASLIYRLDNSFWRFSIAIYQNECVKKSCLAFQENHQINVNLLLLCCWLAYSVEEISKSDLLNACRSVENWHTNVTQPLRATRKWLKSLNAVDPWTDDFYQLTLMDEIASETYQQHCLFSYFENRQKTPDLNNEALAITYLHWLFNDFGDQTDIDSALKTDIGHFVRLVFSMVATHEKITPNHRD
ncbi:MAG: TIGR02444 family protein [Legionella sp.]|nr:TIGR02444 family protein [Legionella sp.]